MVKLYKDLGSFLEESVNTNELNAYHAMGYDKNLQKQRNYYTNKIRVTPVTESALVVPCLSTSQICCL